MATGHREVNIILGFSQPAEGRGDGLQFTISGQQQQLKESILAVFYLRARDTNLRCDWLVGWLESPKVWCLLLYCKPSQSSSSVLEEPDLENILLESLGGDGELS